jgi:fibronectin-binding autotransporter adhesin
MIAKCLLLCRFVAILTVLITIANLPVQAATWNNLAGGDFNDPLNWTGGVPNAPGAVADFSTLDLNGDVSVALDTPTTVGQILFGDTNLGTGGTWELRTNITPIPVITLNNNGPKPIITVNQLTPTSFDDAFIGHSLAGSAGFVKQGAGILTLGPGTTNTITGGIDVAAGTLRLGAAVPGQAISIGNGATLQTAATIDGPGHSLTAAPGSTVNLRTTASVEIGNLSMNGATLNVHLNTAATTLTADNSWAVNGAPAAVNFSSTAGGFIRMRPNGGAFNTATAFATSAVNMDNITVWTRTNSGGNDVNFGSLSGTSTAVLGGGGQGGGTAARYFIGSLNTDTEFAGTINSTSTNGLPTPLGGINIIKQGTGTLTLSGTINNPPQVVGTSASTDPTRRGAVTQIQNGRIRLTNSATITGGIVDATAGTVESTIDVQATGILDVTGYTAGTYATQSLQQIVGTGTLIGNWNHAAGIIRPGNVPTNFSHVTTPVAGNITFNGNMQLSGGDIGHDASQSAVAGNDHISVTGSVDITGGRIRPNFLNGVPSPTNTYIVLTAAGGITGSAASMVVDFPGRSPDGVPSINGNTLVYNAGAVLPAKNLTWVGTTATWDEEVTLNNWTDGVSPEKFFQFDNVVFDDTATTKAVAITGQVRPGNVVVNTNTAYSFAGPGTIAAGGTFTKTGTGDLTFTTGGQYTSASVQNGTVTMGNVAGAFGAGPLSLTNVNTVTNVGWVNSSINFAGTNTVSIAGTGAQANAYGLSTMGGSGTLTFTTSIADKWMQWGGSTGFTGTVNIGTVGQTGVFSNLRLQSGGGGNNLSGVVLNIAGPTIISNRTGSGATATFQFGEIHATDPGSQLLPFFGGTASDAVWEIGALNGNSDFAGLIVDSGTFRSHITKVGTGTLTLSNLNTYTGVTSVLGGTLSITQPYLGDTAEVRIATGSVFNLNFVGTDTIGGLQIAGAVQPIGTYGAPGSGATFTSSFFTGTGILSVTELFTQAGDFDGDGDVDGRDFLVWQRGGSPNGNANTTDLIAWQNNYGTQPTTLTAASTAVPEPSSLVLLLAGVLALGRRSRIV